MIIDADYFEHHRNDRIRKEYPIDSHDTMTQTGELLGECRRLRMLTALMDGQSWPAGDLARHAGIQPATASYHLEHFTRGRPAPSDSSGVPPILPFGATRSRRTARTPGGRLGASPSTLVAGFDSTRRPPLWTHMLYAPRGPTGRGLVSKIFHPWYRSTPKTVLRGSTPGRPWNNLEWCT